MNVEDFRKSSKDIIDFICQCHINTALNGLPKVQKGLLTDLIADKPPEDAQDFNTIFSDFKNTVLPSLMHSKQPKLFNHLMSKNLFPSILVEMLINALGTIGFSWNFPAAMELETIILDWYAKALDLPEVFLSDKHKKHTGGGVLQNSSTECILHCIIAARSIAIKKLKGNSFETHDSIYLPQLTAYASKDANASIAKAAKIALVKLRTIETDQRGCIRLDILQKTIQNDLKAGLTPFFVVATLGTMKNVCAFDDLKAISQICKTTANIWFHVDGAYAGNLFILPEIHIFSQGLEFADSFNVGQRKLFFSNFDFSAMWVRDMRRIKSTLNMLNYELPTSCRLKALKMWFSFRTLGTSKIQDHLRKQINLTETFKLLNFQLKAYNNELLGIVCIKTKLAKEEIQCLLKRLESKEILRLTPILVNGISAVRLCCGVCNHAAAVDTLLHNVLFLLNKKS